MVFLRLFQKLMGDQLFNRGPRGRVIIDCMLNEVPQLGIYDALEDAAFLLFVDDSA